MRVPTQNNQKPDPVFDSFGESTLYNHLYKMVFLNMFKQKGEL